MLTAHPPEDNQQRHHAAAPATVVVHQGRGRLTDEHTVLVDGSDGEGVGSDEGDGRREQGL